MLFNGQIAPFLMNNICQYGILVFFFDFIVFPIIRQLISDFLPHHSLLNPFLIATHSLPIITTAIKRFFRIIYFFNPLIPDPRQPNFYRLGFLAWYGLNEAQKRFNVSGVSIS